jgi:hypothetical protein
VVSNGFDWIFGIFDEKTRIWYYSGLMRWNQPKSDHSVDAEDESIRRIIAVLKDWVRYMHVAVLQSAHQPIVQFENPHTLDSPKFTLT